MPQQTFKLIPFNKDRESTAGQIQVSGNIQREGNILTIAYDITDSYYEIHWPNPVAKPLRKDALWQNTCMELFIAPWGVKGYWEFNFAPNGEWNCYRFDEMRVGQKPEFSIQSIESKLLDINSTHKQLRVTVPLFKEIMNSTWSVGVCAVVRDKNRALHYYALTHCSQEPDFHLRNSFMLTLAGK